MGQACFIFVLPNFCRQEWKQTVQLHFAVKRTRWRAYDWASKDGDEDLCLPAWAAQDDNQTVKTAVDQVARQTQDICKQSHILTITPDNVCTRSKLYAALWRKDVGWQWRQECSGGQSRNAFMKACSDKRKNDECTAGWAQGCWDWKADCILETFLSYFPNHGKEFPKESS